MKSELKNEIRDQVIFLVCFVLAWYAIYKMQVFNELLFPSPGQIFDAFIAGFEEDGMMAFTLYSLSLIAKGLAIGIGLAFIFSSIAVVSKHFRAIYNLVVSICDLLPGVALLPLAICWFENQRNNNHSYRCAFHNLAYVQKHHRRIQCHPQHLY